MSAPRVQVDKFDTVYVNAMVMVHVPTEEVDELLEQAADALILELKTKMPNVPRNKVIPL